MEPNGISNNKENMIDKINQVFELANHFILKLLTN